MKFIKKYEYSRNYGLFELQNNFLRFNSPLYKHSLIQPLTNNSITNTSNTLKKVMPTSTLLLQHSRRFLLYTSIYQPPTAATPPATGKGHNVSEPYPHENAFDANVVMVLSVLLCALICSLGLNSIVRCALRCSSLLASGSGESVQLANIGVKKKALKSFTTINYSAGSKLFGLGTECVICLSEFLASDRVKVLPTCNHGFHIRCIDQWLNSHSSCPTCRHCLVETCEKMASCHLQASTTLLPAPPPPQEIMVIVPLEQEGIVHTSTVQSLLLPLPLPLPPSQESRVIFAPLEHEGVVRDY